MRNPPAPPSAALYAQWTKNVLAEIDERSLTELARCAARWTHLPAHRYDALIQACEALETALDAVDLELLKHNGLWERLAGRWERKAVVFNRQLANLQGCWTNLQVCAVAIERVHAQAMAAGEKRLVLEIGLATEECQLLLSRAIEWHALVDQQLPSRTLEHARLVPDIVHRLQARISEVGAAAAVARDLLEHQELVQGTRTLVIQMLDTELRPALMTWESCLNQVLDLVQRRALTRLLAASLASQHSALRRLAHKVKAACIQLHQHDTLLRESAGALSRTSDLLKRRPMSQDTSLRSSDRS